MQKTLRKPENWQDFESLAKKLWGELWEIPFKIKKNGRLGQPQNGVDVYGIPKNEEAYWGIQCKGKNDYNNSKLTKSEINKEVEEAKKFNPELKVFIIATTQNKDVEIEQYVRVKDIESRNNGDFEIILFCWEDIADLIEENRQTLNWYLGINNFREKYDIDVTFITGESSLIINPKFLKKITKYKVATPNVKTPHIGRAMILPQIPSMFESNEVNHSWCTVEISIQNNGNVVLEDWYLKLKLDNAKKISDGFNVSIFVSNDIKKMMYDNRTLFENKNENSFVYEPAQKEPLIQKSGRSFKINFIPHFNQKSLNITWDFFARDFDKSGTLEIELQPDFIEKINYSSVTSKQELKDDKIEIEYFIEKKGN